MSCVHLVELGHQPQGARIYMGGCGLAELRTNRHTKRSICIFADEHMVCGCTCMRSRLSVVGCARMRVAISGARMHVTTLYSNVCIYKEVLSAMRGNA